MLSALLYKELRETAGIAALGAVALLAVATSCMGWGLMFVTAPAGRIPFLSDSFQFYFCLASGALAIVLGFRQSIGDFLGDSYLFLLHRPVNRRTIYGSKLLVGLLVYVACSVVPILWYSWWASLPGTHASPFAWSMTVGAWMGWLSITAVYLGTFLSGIRPAAWFGTRLAPLAAACCVAFLTAMLPWWAGLPVLIAVDAVLGSLILFVADTRDFAS